MEEEGRREEKERCGENEDKIDHHRAMEKGPLCSGPVGLGVLLCLINEIYDACPPASSLAHQTVFHSILCI